MARPHPAAPRAARRLSPHLTQHPIPCSDRRPRCSRLRRIRRVFNLVPLLIERGFSPSLAALTLGLGGAGQVIGASSTYHSQRRPVSRVRTVSVIVVAGLSTAWLGLASSAAALIGIAVGAGLVRGIFTLIQATAITDR